MGKYNKHVILLGSARSGTSWFSELIAQQFRYRMLFEPEHEFNTKNGVLLCDKYVAQEGSKKIDAYLDRIFMNRVDCNWIGQVSNRKWKRHLWPIIPKKFIIKFVRCNLFFDYFTEKFEIPVIFLIRNPYNVLASQSRVKFPWLYDLSHFQSQDNLCDLILKNFGFDLKQTGSLMDLEKLCIRWCIENTVPFINGSKTIKDVYRYEELASDISEFYSICKKYNLTPLSDLEDLYHKPSSKTHSKSEIITGAKIENPFSKKEYDIINQYLDIFKIDYYDRKYS